MKGRQDTKYELQYCYYRRKNILCILFIFKYKYIYEELPMNISKYLFTDIIDTNRCNTSPTLLCLASDLPLIIFGALETHAGGNRH